jgi:hypothetical protein
VAYRFSTNTRNVEANAAMNEVDAGPGAGTIAIRTGAQPTNVGDADTGTLLGTLTFSDPAFTAAATGVKTASAITSDTSADASGTAGHFRVKDSTGAIHSDGTCGLGSGDLSFDNNVIVAGGTIAITSFVVTFPI